MDEIIDWGDVQGYLLGRLGFCGCGIPDVALSLINDLLAYIEEFRSKPYTGSFQGKEWDAHCSADKAALQKVIDDNQDGVKSCLFYLVSSKNITNHGGSIPGWIEDHEFRRKLKSYIDYMIGED